MIGEVIISFPTFKGIPTFIDKPLTLDLKEIEFLNLSKIKKLMSIRNEILKRDIKFQKKIKISNN